MKPLMRSLALPLLPFLPSTSGLWPVMAFAAAAVCSWRLAQVLGQHNARDRETSMARAIARAYILAAVCLYIADIVFG